MTSNQSTSSQSFSQPTPVKIPQSQPMPIAHRSLSQSAAQSPNQSGSVPGSPLSLLQGSNIPFIRRLFPPPPTLSSSVPADNQMNQLNHLQRHGPMALSYRRHSIDVSSLRSMRAEADEAAQHVETSSAFVDEPVDASALSAKATGHQGPSRVLEGFCKYEWDFSG